MSRLKVILRGAQISDLALVIDKEYIGGRKESCDIRLQAEKGISREHFKLKFEDGKWVVNSLSRFGEIFSLGQRIETTILEHGQVFQVPPYEFIFSDVADAVLDQPTTTKNPVNETERTIIGAVPQVPYIKMLSSSGAVREMLRLEVGDAWVSGRDPSCQIIIPDQRVSRRQFEVRKINGNYTIIDLSSVNGTFLNGSPISSIDPQTLKSGDAISVLDNIMYFELHDPNFQYRLDRIEVPPLKVVENFEDEENIEVEAGSQVSSQNLENQASDSVEEIEDPSHFEENFNQGQNQNSQRPNYPQNFNPNGQQQYNQQNSNQQQMYNQPFHDPQTGRPFAGQGFPPPPTPPESTPLQRLFNNKPVFISLVLLFLVGAYFIGDYINSPDPKSVTTQNNNLDPSDPLSKLKPEERENIKLWYSNAEKALKQQQFSIAKDNLDKIYSLLPTGYKDSDVFLAEAKNGEQTILAQQENERREKEQAETKALIKATLEKCEKIITPATTLSEIELCLAPVSTSDPTNETKDKLIARVQKYIDDRKQKEDTDSVVAAQVQALKDIFAEAERVNSEGYPKKTMRAYEKVILSTLPDPNDLKLVSKKRIKIIQSKLKQKNQKNLNTAEAFIKEGNLKEGVLSLRKALDFDPENEEIKNKIERYTNDLRNRVKVMYQESIIDENFGYIDGAENKAGAKQKWKEIISLDLEDGDYYRKAYIKLKRYGVF